MLLKLLFNEVNTLLLLLPYAGLCCMNMPKLVAKRKYKTIQNSIYKMVSTNDVISCDISCNMAENMLFFRGVYHALRCIVSTGSKTSKISLENPATGEIFAN